MLSIQLNLRKTITVILSMLILHLTPLLYAAERSSAGLSASDAYFRLMPPERPVSAAYMQLLNNSEGSQVLVGMHSERAERVELHEHSYVNGMMRMRKVDRLVIASGETVSFKPGGYHLMLFGLEADLRLGDSIDIVLLLESGASLTVNASARSLK